jgi:glutathione S-transferase
MKLYYMKGACSLASLIALKIAGVKCEAVAVDPKSRKAQDGEQLNTLNGKGYVPVLRLDDDQILTENVAVLQYIADLNPSAKLAPVFGTLERYRLVEALAYISSEVHKNFGLLFNPSNDDEIKRLARDNLKKRIDWLDEALGAKDFLMGDTFTVADAYLYVVLGWTKRPDVGIDLQQWVALKRHHDTVSVMPQVIAAQMTEGA